MLDRKYEVYSEPDGTKFYESWCTDLEKSAIEYAVNQVSKVEGGYYEIGSFEGRSAVFTANSIDPQTLVTIDPFSPIPEAGGEIPAYKARDIESIFHLNIDVGTNGNVDHQKMGWEEYFEANPSAQAAYIYLDGPHTYEDVFKSLPILVERLVPGGVMIGDDYDDHMVKAAVDDFFGKEMYHPCSWRTFYFQKGKK